MSKPITCRTATGARMLGLALALAMPSLALGQEAAAPATPAPVTPAPAAAPTTAPLVLSYAAFEASVPHADMVDCPTALAAPDRFCRMTLAAETVSVWVFALEGEQPLLALQPYDIEELTIEF